jgi:hypothetical protein
VSPYVNGPFDSRAMSVAEAVATAELSDLNQQLPASRLGNGATRPQDLRASNQLLMRTNPRHAPRAADHHKEATVADAPSASVGGVSCGFVLY